MFDLLCLLLNLYLNPHRQFESSENITGPAILNIAGWKKAKWGSLLKIEVAAAVP